MLFSIFDTIPEAQTIYDSKKPYQEAILSLKWQVKIITPLECTRKIGKVGVVEQAKIRVIGTRETSRKTS